MSCWLALLLFASLIQLQQCKYVTSVLSTKWQSTPLLLEASEFFAEEKNAYFFKFIRRVGGVEYPNDKAEYDAILLAALELFPAVTVSLLKLSSSLRQYSPRAVMFNKIAADIKGSLACDAFLQINSIPTCINQDISTLIKSPKSSNKVKLIKHDHIYASHPDTTQIILYCDFRTPSCYETHLELSSISDQNEISYVFRHFYEPAAGQVQLSGYGVELAIKSMEYTAVDDSVVTDGEKEEIMKTREEEEVEGFRFGVLKELYPDHKDKLDKFKDHLIESKDDMKPLKAWEISDLGYQAAQKIVSSSSDKSLSVLTKYSQNLPSLARSLCRTQVKLELRAEVQKNQEILQRYNVQPGNSVLLLNGMLIDLESADPFTLLKKLRSEAKTVGGLASLGIQFSDVNTLLKADLYRQGMKYGIDIRDDAIIYINNLEEDTEYQYWPASVSELLRPSYPGMLKHLRKNIHNLVLVIRPSEPGAMVLLKLIQTLLEHSAPIRVGLIFTSDGTSDDTLNVDTLLPAMVYSIVNEKGKASLRDFLTDLSEDAEKLTVKDLQSVFSDVMTVAMSDEWLSENGALLSVGNQFIESSGVSSSTVIINGVVIDDLSDVEETILETIQAQLPKLQRAVYLGEVTDTTNILDWYMDSNNILPRHNPAVLGTDMYTVPLVELEKAGSSYQDLDDVLQSGPWFGADDGIVSMVLVGDYEDREGKELLGSVMASLDKVTHSRITLLFPVSNDLNFALWLTLTHSDKDQVVSSMSRVQSDGVTSLPDDIAGLFREQGEREKFEDVVRIHSTIAHSVLHITPHATGVMCNGRVITPLPSSRPQDIELMEMYELKAGASKVQEILEGHSGDIVMRAGSVLRNQEAVSRISFPDLSSEHSAVIVPGEGPFEVEAVLDPLSTGAQQISHILHVLHSAKLIKLRIILNPKDKLSEMPVQRFYRYVLLPELEFTEEGAISSSAATATFTDLLPHLLLTMSLSTPVNWMVASTRSPYDMDNIRLNDVDQGVHAEYTLDYLIIEGHSHDPLRYNNPTKGLQYVLTSGKTSYDTIVMANLGYFQLKAGPGVWTLSLRDGPSREIYKIVGVEEPGVLQESGDVTITVGDLTSTFITVEATKKDGMEKRSVSEENQMEPEEDGGGIWDSLKSFVGTNGKAGASNVNDTINIFSVASGHLYERMLGVMMQTVLAHTENPVKFWFLKNYLSPKFISSVPIISKELGCEIEFVQYQWPSWLLPQTEKQRIIWGYKILFLDVLFPLNVKKFIFVDADQIVRADMKELIDLDLKGAPYGYTPFCDDRPEMDGFRFWKQGYWRNHLMGRAYHISALYVVDLQRFRQISAGDRLRGQYQGLSQDPNSLANLDQDLPNNMIHHVPIFSLPQEWLWCETWCSDASKAYAKTIDLCNNPLTKEPKLDRAMRIAPEWKEYDKKLKQILENAEIAKKYEESKEKTMDDDPTPHSEL